MSKFEVKLQQFSGPLNKLLELIEAKDLEITEIILASVTEDFLEHLKKIESEIEPAVLSDFLVVASKLVLIKSKTLLPDLALTEEEEESIEDLETRLQIYKEFAARPSSFAKASADKEENRKTASSNIKELWDKKSTAVSRQLFLSLKDASFFYPAPNSTLENLTKSLSNLASTFEAFMPKTEKIKSVIISLEQKVGELVNRLKEAAEHSFLNLSQQKSREEVVVTFLALLHLFRKRTIMLKQENQFGDIIIRGTSDK